MLQSVTAYEAQAAPAATYAGTWTIDNDKTDLIGMVCAACREEMGVERIPDAAMAQLTQLIETTKVDMHLTADGSWTVDGMFMGEPVRERGTWTSRGSRLTFRRTHENGKPLSTPYVFTGTHEESWIRTRPDKDTQGDIYLKRVEG